MLRGSELGALQSKLLLNMRKLLGLCVPVRALMRRVSDFAHFLPDTQGFSNFGLLKIEKNTKKRRKKNARPGATGGEILYSILHYCFSHVIGIRTDRGKPFLVVILAQLAVQPATIGSSPRTGWG